MRIIYLFFAVILFNIPVFSQDFTSVLVQIGSELKTVTTKTNTIAQTISEPSHGVVEISQTFTQTKSGKSQTETYVFNPSDIDINTIRTVTNKEVIEVQLLVKNKQKLIKKTLDHTKVAYVDAVYIRCMDINNGRTITDLIKAMVPLATEITEKRLSLNTYQDHLNWLTGEIGEITVGEKQFAQNITADPNYYGRLSYSVLEATTKSSKKSLFEFNAMNINPNAILFKVSGDVFSLEVETKRKQNIVKQFVNDEQKNFTNSFEITCKSVEQARDIQKVLKEFIALSETEFNKNLPKINSASQAFSVINKLIGKVTVNDVTFSQSFESDCVTKFMKNEASSSKNTSEVFEFNFSDLNKNSIGYKANRQFLIITLITTAKNNLIKQAADNVQKNYTGSVDIVVSEVEEAIILENALQYLVGECEKNDISYKDKNKQQLQSLLSEEIKKVTAGNKTFDQTLSKGSSENAMSFKQMEITEKTSKEKLFEFNYTDINPSSVVVETSQKNVFVVCNTRFNEKIIQYYEDGVIKNYQNSIRIEAESIENARRIAAFLKELIEK